MYNITFFEKYGINFFNINKTQFYMYILIILAIIVGIISSINS